MGAWGREAELLTDENGLRYRRLSLTLNVEQPEEKLKGRRIVFNIFTTFPISPAVSSGRTHAVNGGASA